MSKRQFSKYSFIFLSILAFTIMACFSVFAADPSAVANTKLRDFLLKVYQTMDKNYYMPVSQEAYQKFIDDYPAERLIQINRKTNQSNNYLHLGAGLLVNKIKHKSDAFTNFVPAEKSKEFKSSSYAVTEDLGMEGTKTKTGFEITKVQKHCEAYAKGIRAGDTLLAIDDHSAVSMDEDEIQKLLSPTLGTVSRIRILFKASKDVREVTLESKSYFKETVTSLPSEIPDVLVLKISHFNQKSSDDFADELSNYGIPHIQHLVLDLRDNGGGPPLAAREILGFFLPANEPLFAFARKKKRPIMLTAARQSLSYRGLVTVLVNQKTGSAAETFGGILQDKKIATLVGQKTAGATYLKSIFDFEDGSMVFMITSLTFFEDKRIFPADGLTPDILVDKGEDSLKLTFDKIKKN